MHPVTVQAAPVLETPAPVCKSNFGIGGLTNNRKNGTAKLRVRLHTAGSIFLFGKKVHAISRKTKAAGSMTLTIHARVELNKRLKKIHHARVPVRITFTPTAAAVQDRAPLDLAARAPRSTANSALRADRIIPSRPPDRTRSRAYARTGPSIDRRGERWTRT